MTMKIRKAVIPAGGLGTRFLPASKVVAKELIPIVDRPTIQYVMEELKEAGVEEFVLVISKGKEILPAHFRPAVELESILRAKGKTQLLQLVEETSHFGKITTVYQDEPLGLGHAVLCARDAVGDDPFLVALADDLVDAKPGCAKQMVSLFAQFQKAMVAVQEVPLADVNKYGIITPRYTQDDPQHALDKEKRLLPLRDFQEKPKREAAASRLAIVGRYLLLPEIFPILEKTTQGAAGEIQLTDALKTYNEQADLLAYQFTGKRFDTGDKLGFLQANFYFGLKHPEVGDILKEYLRKEGFFT